MGSARRVPRADVGRVRPLLPAAPCQPMKSQVKTAVCFALTLAFSAGGVVHMTSLPQPGAVGQAHEASDSYAGRQLSERLRESIYYQCEDIGRRSSRYSAKGGILIEFLEDSVLRAGFELSTEDYDVERFTFQNVIGTLKGTGEGTIVVGTHYDSYGKSMCANAVATPVAALIETMYALRGQSFEKTIVFAFFGTGEKPHRGKESAGAHQWLAKATEGGMQIDQAIILGSFGRFGTVVAGQNSSFPWYLTHPDTADWVGMYSPFTSKDTVKDALVRWGSVTDLPARGFAAPTWMMGIPAEDQTPFIDAGIPTVFLSDTGAERDPNLRSKSDMPYDIDFPAMALRVEAFIEFVKGYAGS